MRRQILLIAALGAIAIPAQSQAHFLWASLDASKKVVAIGLQELPTVPPVPLGERAPKVKAWSKPSSTIALKEEGTWLKGTVEEPVVAVSLDYGVLDKRDQGRGVFWLNYFAKAATTGEASQATLGLPLELTALKAADGKWTLTALVKGKPKAGAEVTIENEDGSAGFEGKTGPDGTLVLPATKGALAVRALVTDNAKGTHDGKNYDLVRSYCTLTVQDGATAPAKPLTRQLSEAFGKNHEIVSNTAFIQTLMSGKVTKPQVEAHFQQRALIHMEIDRIMNAAGADKLPYGADQKSVLTLLKADMEKMGFAWPTEAQAWPSTKAFLDEMRESAKQGPYFALGVMHVYYGGITHGGRDIGAIIGDAMKSESTYYLKSDGYNDYSKKVNQITDPAAQKEMIRGGVEAYKYIIASNDAEIFKSK